MSMRQSKPNCISVILVTLITVCMGACGSVSELKDSKKDWNSGDYAAIAAQDIRCKPSEEGCNQLYLLKGDACFRLAKLGREPQKHYQCAAVNLSAGIQATQQWQMTNFNLNRPQTFENLCEARRSWRDLESGTTAEAINRQLLAGAEAFLAAEPGNLAAIYFLNNARYAALQSCLVHTEACPSLCQDLTAIGRSLQEAVPRAQGSNYEANFRELSKEISKEQTMLSGCQ